MQHFPVFQLAVSQFPLQKIDRELLAEISIESSVHQLLELLSFYYLDTLFTFGIKRRLNCLKTSLIDAVFRLERFTEVSEFTYLGKHFPCVDAN